MVLSGANDSVALSIQNPSQTGPRTRRRAFPHPWGYRRDLNTAAGEESSAIRAIAECAVGGALRFIYQATPLFLESRNPAAPFAWESKMPNVGYFNEHLCAELLGITHKRIS
jgi:hypothetical protein